MSDERPEEGYLRFILTHPLEIRTVGSETHQRNIGKDILKEGFPEEIVAGYPSAVPACSVNDVAEDPLIVGIGGKSLPEDTDHAAFFHEAEDQVGVSEDGVDSRL